MGAAGFTLVDCGGEDFEREAVDLHVHLEGGDALLCSGDFKVHIACEIFGVGDVA